MIFKTSQSQFIWSSNADGLAIRFSDSKRYEKAKTGQANETDQIAFVRMQMLTESGQASTQVVENGIFISTPDAVRLDTDTRECFNLPPSWPGGMRLQTGSVPQLPEFRASLGMVDPAADLAWDWTMRGPVLQVDGNDYLPTSAQYTAIAAYKKWQDEQHDEFSNLSLLSSLRDAWDEGCYIDMEVYNDVIISEAEELSVSVRGDEKSGDLVLRPVVTGHFPELDADLIEERLSQLNVGDERTVLRVGKTIVLLDDTQTKQARAVVKHGRIPSDQHGEFIRNPSKWLANNVFPDLETDFSPRVIGIGEWKGGYLGANWDEAQDWFGKKPAPGKPIPGEPTPIEGPPDSGGDQKGEGSGSDPKRVIVPLIIPNDEELGFGWSFQEIPLEGTEPYWPDFSEYQRPPYPHQEKAVRWLLDNAKRAQNRAKIDDDSKGYGAGVLLADDMGLGKTYSVLIFISEWINLWRKTTSSQPPAILVVAPLSLLDNWKNEIGESYGDQNSVFTRVLIAQGDNELNVVRRSPNSQDIAKPGEVVQYGLGFGDGTERSVDFPGSCVLTTYQTLRNYRFSFAKSEWSAVIFDEAQNIKNPNALQTIAAKALKGLYRIMLTGTPVENHLGDFWCILDTAEPGPLGSFSEFRKEWILRMKREPEKAIEIGKELRDRVGGLMLRRTKKDELKGLPTKEGENKPIIIDMTPEQLNAYESVVKAICDDEVKHKPDEKQKNNQQLAALWRLRQVSLHPDLISGGDIRLKGGKKAFISEINRSGKLKWLLNCLDNIKSKDEKALIFCVQKKLQEALSIALGKIYDLSVPVINGDTKATTKINSEKTRLGLIGQFSEQHGFGICILSPIAAGAGLNIVAANHVIHLERHWNPAKEDQATDRVYRIGQTRSVRVYLPVLAHPSVASFDLVLYRLLEKKRELQGALGLVPPDTVSGPEIINELFRDYKTDKKDKKFVDLQSSLNFSWQLFEALIAVIYKNKAKRVILTPGGSDHGCDIVVLGWGKDNDNFLIQCKKTGQATFNSEVAVREVEGARPFYEKALGVTFKRRCLHTTSKKFSRRTKNAAEICGVELYDRKWISEILGKNKIEYSTVLKADLNREKII